MAVTVEEARRRELQRRGIGGSREAVMARRVREQRARIVTIEGGDLLPGWMEVPGMATQENITAYLEGLDQVA